MWKFIRYIIYIAVLIAVFAAAYNVRNAMLVPYIQNYIQKKTGKDMRFNNFYISPFNKGIIITDFNYENKVLAKRVLIKFGVLNIVKHIKTPLNYIKSIEISDVRILLDNIQKNAPSAGNIIEPRNNFFPLPEHPVDIQADRISLITGSNSINIDNTRMSVSRPAISLSASYFILNSSITLNSSMTLKQDGLYDSDISLSSEGDIEALINAHGNFDIFSFDLDQNINIEKMSYKAFDISDISGTAIKKGNDFKFELNGNFGRIEILSETAGEFGVLANIDLSKINQEIEAMLDIRFSRKNSENRINVKADAVKTLNFNIGGFSIDGEIGRNGEFNILYARGGVFINYSQDGDYIAKLVSNDKTTGTFTGNIKTGEIKADMKEADISKMPFAALLGADPKGKITVQGEIDEYSGKINFVLRDFHTKTIDKTDVYGSIARNGGMYVFNFYKSDNSVVFNSVIKDRQILSTDFKFVNTDIANVLRMFGRSTNKIKGMANGRIKYEKDGTTEFDFKAFDGFIYDNKFKKLEAKGDVNLNRISIEQFVLKDDKNVVRAYINALFGFTEDSPDSSFDMNLKDIKIAGAKLNGRILFNGTLAGNREVKGKFEGTNVSVSGISFPALSADSVISTKRFVISELKSENGLSGNFKADFVKKNLSGTINFKNTDIKGFYPELSAAVNSAVKLNGSFQNPSARITANIKKAKYSGIPFSFDADFISRNGKISVKKFDLVSDKTRISASGVYSKIGKLNIVFEKIPEKLINKFVGFVTPVKGDFSGSGTLIQRNGRKHLKMFLTGENTSVKNVKISGFKSNFEIYKNKISLSSASAKIADSEIKAPSGSFNLKTGSYGLELKLVNTHVGPVDVFGNVILSGSMKKKKGGSEYRGTITLNNFWINRYKLLQSEFNYHIHNKIFEFASANSKPNIFKSSGTVVFGEGVFIKNFIVEHEKSLFVMNSGIASDNIEIDIKGKDLSLDFITDAFGIPVSMSGTANLRVDFEGNPSNPSATIKTQSSGGSISEIPYDNFEVEIVSKDNRAEIKKAVIYKKNEINVLASGFFPFWIDSTLKNKMRKLPVNISYSIEDPKMTIFKYISQGYVEPLSGKLSLKGSVKGTFDKISNNGQFTITGGSLDVKRYLDKIKDFNADISIVDNLITLNKLSAKSGTGKITGTGTVFLEGFTPQKFDLRFFTENKGIPVKIPELAIPSFIGSKVLLQDYSSGEPRFDITLTGSAEKPKIAGTVILENTRFTFPSANKSSGGDSALPEDTEFDLELKSAKNTRFENSFADAWINGSVFLKGTKNNIRASGIIDSQRGSIQYLGIEFNIINVKVEIMEDHSIYITAEGESEVYSSNKSVSEAIRLVIDRSEINSLNVRFYSRDDPTMDSQTALAKLTKTEQTTERRNRELLLGIITEFDLRQQALRLFDTNFATPFTRTVLRRTGLVDNFKVSYVAPDRDPALVDDTSFVNLLLGTKYSLEKNLTNQFLLGYSLTFDRYDQLERRLDLKHEIEMKYRLANNLFLSGSYELESEASMHQPDRKLMLQHQIRFGQPAKKTN